jgi:hypothetical protein
MLSVTFQHNNKSNVPLSIMIVNMPNVIYAKCRKIAFQLSVIMLNVIMLSVIMLTVVAPFSAENLRFGTFNVFLSFFFFLDEFCQKNCSDIKQFDNAVKMFLTIYTLVMISWSVFHFLSKNFIKLSNA